MKRPFAKPANSSLYVLVSLDVEEEGLFRHTYQTHNPTTKNLPHLVNISGFLQRGIPFTLFCSYAALNDPAFPEIFNHLSSFGKVELGCHLHWWNTPPFGRDLPECLSTVPSKSLSENSLDEKLAALSALAVDVAGKSVTSFRMGRWDLHKNQLPMVAKNGFRQDASIRPFYAGGDGGNGPDHFNAPVNPWLIQTEFGPIYEFPLTVTPVFRWLPVLLKKHASSLRFSLAKWGLLTLLPVEHPLELLKLTTLLYLKKGGKAISLTWHSSEMMPGGNPRLDSSSKCKKFMLKVHRYLDWLEKIYDVIYITLEEAPAFLPPVKMVSPDWAKL